MAFHTCRIDFLHKRIVHKKIQLKIPALSKNDCSATWKPNTNQKNFTRDLLRNVQRYQKYVVILWSFIFIVSDIFKPTVLYTANIYSQTTASLQPNGCISDWITAIDSAQWLAVIQYSQFTVHIQSLTAIMNFHIYLGNSHIFGCNLAYKVSVSMTCSF